VRKTLVWVNIAATSKTTKAPLKSILNQEGFVTSVCSQAQSTIANNTNRLNLLSWSSW